jgi:hypothetical protein
MSFELYYTGAIPDGGPQDYYATHPNHVLESKETIPQPGATLICTRTVGPTEIKGDGWVQRESFELGSTVMKRVEILGETFSQSDVQNQIEDMFEKEMEERIREGTRTDSQTTKVLGIIEDVKQEMKGVLKPEEEEMKKQKDSLLKERRELNSKLSRFKNLKGTSSAIKRENTLRAKKRAKIKKLIAVVDVGLEELDIEENARRKK